GFPRWDSGAGAYDRRRGDDKPDVDKKPGPGPGPGGPGGKGFGPPFLRGGPGGQSGPRKDQPKKQPKGPPGSDKDFGPPILRGEGPGKEPPKGPQAKGAEKGPWMQGGAKKKKDAGKPEPEAKGGEKKGPPPWAKGGKGKDDRWRGGPPGPGPRFHMP